MLILRSALTAALILASVLSSATEALVLISPDAAGPKSDNYGEWVLWPAKDRPGGENRILSLLTGIDWAGNGSELVFGMKDGRYHSGSLDTLKRRGYFLARERVVRSPSSALGDANGFGSPIPLFLALDGSSPVVTPLPVNHPWPSGVVYAVAESWDRVASIASKAGGRVLVVEYPPPPGQKWSRFWLRGPGWGARQPDWAAWKAPGLLPASQLGNLLIHPESFEWGDNDSGNWGGADRWLSFVGYSAPLTLAILGFLAAFFVGCTVYLLSIEEHARVGGVALKYFMLVPADILFCGLLNRYLGPSLAGLWLATGFLSLACASQVGGAICARVFPDAHPMLGISIVGFAATACSAPLWSMYSNVFGVNVLPLSPEAAGALTGYLAAICAFGRGKGPGQWLGPILALACLVWGIAANPWWVAGQWPFVVLPIVAVLAGEKLFRLWMLPLFMLLPLVDGRLIRYGVVWAPGNLFPTFFQSQSLNLARHAEFFVSHGFLGALIIGGGMAIFVERYLFHEIRRTLLRDSRIKSFFFASYLCAAMGILQPLMFYPALFCFVGGAFVVLSDTARAA